MAYYRCYDSDYHHIYLTPFLLPDDIWWKSQAALMIIHWVEIQWWWYIDDDDDSPLILFRADDPIPPPPKQLQCVRYNVLMPLIVDGNPDAIDTILLMMIWWWYSVMMVALTRCWFGGIVCSRIWNCLTYTLGDGIVIFVTVTFYLTIYWWYCAFPTYCFLPQPCVVMINDMVGIVW